MDWKPLQEQVQAITGVLLRIEQWNEHEWLKRFGTAESGVLSLGRSLLGSNDLYYMPLERNAGQYTMFVVEQLALTKSEQQLIELIIKQQLAPQASTQPDSGAVKGEEQYARELGQWVKSQLDAGERDATIPTTIVLHSALDEQYIPLLLSGEYGGNQSGSYSDLRKLLESFFDETIVLVPLLDKEWIILAPVAIYTASTDVEKDEEPDSAEDALSSIGSGLYEMLASEWIGECHLVVSHPIVPVDQLVQTIYDLRETMELGMLFQVGVNLHLPWMLHLERLLHAVPIVNKQQFLSQTIKQLDAMSDGEMLLTLETFFMLDCNVSETAKKLYIHRNTLLYRLDKFKQETGLDVRTFRQAVLVNLLLVLYKVTKRK